MISNFHYYVKTIVLTSVPIVTLLFNGINKDIIITSAPFSVCLHATDAGCNISSVPYLLNVSVTLPEIL